MQCKCKCNAVHSSVDGAIIGNVAVQCIGSTIIMQQCIGRAIGSNAMQIQNSPMQSKGQSLCNAVEMQSYCSNALEVQLAAARPCSPFIKLFNLAAAAIKLHSSYRPELPISSPLPLSFWETTGAGGAIKGPIGRSIGGSFGSSSRVHFGNNSDHILPILSS